MTENALFLSFGFEAFGVFVVTLLCNESALNASYKKKWRIHAMEVSCKVIQDLLPLYLDGVSSEESAALVEAHLAGCAQCASVKEKMAEKAVAPKPISNSERVKNPFRKLKRATRRTLIISVAATFVLCAALTAAVTFKTAGYRGVGDLLSLDYDEAINMPQYEDALRQMIAADEGWNPGEIEFVSETRQFEHDPAGNWAVFLRTLGYKGQEYLCAIFASEVMPGEFAIYGYEFASHDTSAGMWLFSRGGVSELPR